MEYYVHVFGTGQGYRHRKLAYAEICQYLLHSKLCIWGRIFRKLFNSCKPFFEKQNLEKSGTIHPKLMENFQLIYKKLKANSCTLKKLWSRNFKKKTKKQGSKISCDLEAPKQLGKVFRSFSFILKSLN